MKRGSPVWGETRETKGERDREGEKYRGRKR